jgi:chromosome segregation ATPase
MISIKGNTKFTGYSDEFDVFMDAVNRRISMKMMVRDFQRFARAHPPNFCLQIDTANSSDGKQYILITPQNMQNIHVGPTVRVHRMSDPERGQGTLAGGTSIA